MQSTKKTDYIGSDELTPQEISRRLNQMDQLYVAGKELAWMGLRYDHPNASDEELEQRWQTLLRQRQRGKWGAR